MFSVVYYFNFSDYDRQFFNESESVMLSVESKQPNKKRKKFLSFLVAEKRHKTVLKIISWFFITIQNLPNRRRNEGTKNNFVCSSDASCWSCWCHTNPITHKNGWNVLDFRLGCVLQFIVYCRLLLGFVCFGSWYFPYRYRLSFFIWFILALQLQ